MENVSHSVSPPHGSSCAHIHYLVLGVMTMSSCLDQVGQMFCYLYIDQFNVLISGEKTVPAPLEGHIGAHPLVDGVLAFGRGHQQIGILVEPKAGYAPDPTNAAVVAEFRNTIW